MTTTMLAETQLTDAQGFVFATHPRKTAAAELANERPRRFHRASALILAAREA